MIAAVVLGAGTGVGLWLLLGWSLAPGSALRQELSHVKTPQATDPAPVVAERSSVGLLRRSGLPRPTTLTALRMLDHPVNTHLIHQAVAALAGLLGPWLLHVLLVLAGLDLGLEIPLITGLAGAALGGWMPSLLARSRADKARRDFAHALSAYLDLVWITLAGGAGIESALLDAAATGTGPAFTRIQRALRAAQLTRTTPWAALAHLGDDLDLPVLTELSASVTLAGTEGARVQASLEAKARALRTHQITDAEADAQAATERMALPVTLLFLGFLTFIAYPATQQVVTGL